VSHEKFCTTVITFELKLAKFFMLPFRINSTVLKQDVNWFQCSITENDLYDCNWCGTEKIAIYHLV